jgi:hypothetical protein
MLTRFVAKSANKKTGPIPVSTSSAVTCPDACPLKARGCYASAGQPLKGRWQEVTDGKAGMEWPAFLNAVRKLPNGTFWRHNQAGDLPGINNEIDQNALAMLIDANTDKRGFTYTHKPMDTRNNRDAVACANANGFTINLSADTLAEADELADLDIAPVVVVLDAEHGKRHDLTTPSGRKVATCPATYRDDVTCASCQLCQRRDRKVIVGFPAHAHKARLPRRLRLTSLQRVEGVIIMRFKHSPQARHRARLHARHEHARCHHRNPHAPIRHTHGGHRGRSFELSAVIRMGQWCERVGNRLECEERVK